MTQDSMLPETVEKTPEGGLSIRDLFFLLPDKLDEQRTGNDLWPYGELPITFGKYIGIMLEEIPLKYLDETVSTMGETWLPRVVRRFVSACMTASLDEGAITELKVPNLSWRQLKERIVKESPDCSFL